MSGKNNVPFYNLKRIYFYICFNLKLLNNVNVIIANLGPAKRTFMGLVAKIFCVRRESRDLRDRSESSGRCQNQSWQTRVCRYGAARAVCDRTEW
jgi:hypothetical protein